MNDFISNSIIKARQTSLEAGQAKYRAYFVAIPHYKNYKTFVDKILTENGYGDCIVTK